MEFPVAYVLKHRIRGTYVPHTNFSYALLEWIAKDTRDDYAWYYTSKLTLAKMWTSYKKIKPRLTKEAAIYFDIVGSDHSIVPAISLFE